MYKPFVVRMATTIPYLALARYANVGPAFLFASTFVLDEIDGRLEPHTNTHDYQRYDKLADWITYALLLLGFAHVYDTTTLALLVAALLWRAIGVWKYFCTDDRGLFRTYADFFNGIMGAHVASLYTSPSLYPYWTTLGILVKLAFERHHHDATKNAAM
jgi:hypothetical protein